MTASSPRLQEQYRESVVPKLREEFGYANVNQVPKLEKIVVNVGLGEATTNPKLLERAMEELAQVTGQKPCVRRARKSVSNFKLREGQPIGATVTLRGWLYNKSSKGKLHFLQLRDGSGIVQCVAFKKNVPEELFEALGG